MISRGTALAPPEKSPAKRLPGPIRDSLAALAIALGIVVITFPLLSSGQFPDGVDDLNGLFRVWYLTGQLLKHASIDQWMPWWYLGNSVLQYYPPLSVLLMLPINVLSQDVLLSHRIFLFLSLWAGAIFAYLIARDWFGRAAGTCAALVFVLAPYNMIIAFAQGSQSRILSIAAAPAIYFIGIKLLRRPSRLLFVALSAATAASVLTDYLQTLTLLLAVTAFAIAYVAFANLPIRNLLAVLLSICLGAALTAWWALPAFTHFDLSNVPYLLTVQAWQKSVGWELLNPGVRREGMSLAYLGASLFGLGLASALLRRDALSWSMLISAAVGLFFATGVNNPLYLNVPFLPAVLIPDQALLPVSLLLAILTSGLVSFRFERLVAQVPSSAVVLVLVAILYTDFSAYFALVRTTDYSPWVAASRALHDLPAGGRFDCLLRNCGPMPYLATVVGGKAQVGGAGGDTAQWQALQNTDRAIDRGYFSYLQRNMSLWNVRSALIDADAPLLQSALQEIGFDTAWADSQRILLKNDKPSSYVSYQDRSIIVVGKGMEIAASVYPWMAQGTSMYLDDYDVDYLARFDGIFLYGCLQRQPGLAERMVRELIRRGKTVFVDMRGSTEATFLGATQWQIDVPDNVVFVDNDPQVIPADTNLDLRSFRYRNEAWRPNSYVNLDGSLVDGIIDGRAWPLLGYKIIDGAKAYFIGYDVSNHAFLTKDERALALVNNLFDVVQPNRTLAPKPLQLDDQTWDTEAPSFTYSLPRDSDVIVSVTYSPHWQVRVDGVATPAYNYENIILVKVPAGRHTVTLSYTATAVQFVGLALTVLAAFILVALVLLSWTKPSRPGIKSGELIRRATRYLKTP